MLLMGKEQERMAKRNGKNETLYGRVTYLLTLAGSAFVTNKKRM